MEVIVKHNTLNLLEENIRENTCDLGLGKCLNMKSRA